MRLSEYQAMCVSLIQEFGELRRLRVAVRRAQKAVESKILERPRKQRDDARPESASLRKHAHRRKKRRRPT